MNAQGNILIVDDEPAIRKVLRGVAERALHLSVTEANDGEEALSLLSCCNPEVVVTDIRMPGMDGVALLRRIKEIDPAIAVVLVTGYPSLDVAIDAMKEGASDFLTKPFRLEQVQVVVEKALREGRLLRENHHLKEEIHRKRAIEELNEKLHRKVKQMAGLCSLGETIAAFPLNRDAILRAMIKEAREATEAGAVFFVVPGGNGESFRTLFRHPEADASDEQGGDATDVGFLTQVLRRRMPLIQRAKWKPSDPSSVWVTAQRSSASRIAVPLLIKGEVMGLLCAWGKVRGEDFDQQDLSCLSELAKRASLGLENKFLYESLYEVLMSTLRSLVSTIEARDPYTKQHSQRVTDLAVLIATQLECTPEQVDTVRVAGYLHDLGKLGVKDSVLLKKDRLTDEEFEQIKAHPVIGEEIIRPIGFLPEERGVIRHHHERWDGKGYPDGIGGEEIPFLARIITVADAFDAMTSDRPYRPRMSLEKGVEEILKNQGTQFDPTVVQGFRAVLPYWAKKLATDEKPNGSS